MTVYATREELRARISDTYAGRPEITDDDIADELLRQASELIDEHTFNRAQTAYDSEDGEIDTPYRDALRDATCDQVEFWMEAGVEHDVAGLKGSVVAGRVQLHPVPELLGTRAKRALRRSGIYWAGVAIG